MPEATVDRWGEGAISVPLLRSAPSDDRFNLHLAAVEYSLATPITIRSRDDIKSSKHWSEVLEPYEHQVRNLITFCRRAPVALIADDVGLGKTISAGLVLSELMTRKRVGRALILCPRLLLPQWCEELRTKFKIEAQFGTGATLDMLLQTSVPVVVTTYETARGRYDDLRKSGFDMLILDEAHKLRNLYGTQNPPKTATVIRDGLHRRHFKYVLMLTATPIQNRLWDIYSLVDCLAVARGHQNPLGHPGQFSYYLADSPTTARVLNPGRKEEFRRKISEYMVRTSRRDSNLIFPDRHVRTIGCPPGSAEIELTRIVSETLPRMNALARSSLAEALMSSPPALASQLRNMAANGTVPSDLATRAEAIVARGGSACKLTHLLAFLDALAKENPDHWRAVVFTRRKETQDLIGRTLRERGVQVGFIRGGQPQENQRAIEAFWKDPPGVRVIVSTDSGAEGVNLQVCNVIVNYDLPWNPMVVEQRIGRVQRLASKHRNVTVVNLVVANSVEERVVARLIAKLQAISETLGDIEGILETTEVGEDQFENTVRDLVIKALMGQDVTAATEKIHQSIEAAKQIYEQEKSEVDQTLGALDGMHSAGPKLPDLQPVVPRIPPEDFVKSALEGKGATLVPSGVRRWLAKVPGQGPVIVTFDENDPDLYDDGLGGIAGPRAQLFVEGRPAFERLVGELAGRDGARVADLRDRDGEGAHATVAGWVRLLGEGTALKAWTPGVHREQFHGDLHLRGSASVSHDRYEKLIGVARPAPPSLDGALDGLAVNRWLNKEIEVAGLIRDVQHVVRKAVEADADIRAFSEFYDRRREEEVAKSRPGTPQADIVAKRFQPMLAAEVVGARGSLYEEVDGIAHILVQGGGPYEVPLTILPAGRVVLSQPPRDRCVISGHEFPAPCLSACAISGSRALRHLLAVSERSGRLGLPQHTATCEVSGRRLLTDEVARSDVSQRLVDASLLQTSALSGKRGLADEMAHCEFTGAALLPHEAARSQVSDKLFRSDESRVSGVSQVRGHRSEFVQCAASKTWVLPSEVGPSSVSGKVVRKDLLVPSEKNPGRRGLEQETVVCQVSGKRLLSDEVERSVVSGAVADKELMAHSARSGSPALPDEMVTCQVSGATLVPAETGTCELTGLRIDRRLLGASALSGKTVQSKFLLECPETKHLGLETEMERCAVSGALVDPSCMVMCAATGQRVVRRLCVPCAVSGRLLLRDKAARSQTGRLGHPDEARTCAWTGWTLLSDEVSACRLTGVTLSNTEVHATGVSMAHARLAEDYESQIPISGDVASLAQQVLAGARFKAGRVWARKAPTGDLLAVLAECKTLMGLRKRYVVAFMDPKGPSLVGTAAWMDVAA